MARNKKLLIKLLDKGSKRTISWSSKFNINKIPSLPTTTTINTTPTKLYTEQELINFVMWYSGMRESSVKKALERYHKEKI